MLVNEWSQAFTSALEKVWFNVLSYIPKLVLALLVFAFGWLLGVILGRLVEQIARALKLDKATESAGLDELASKMGFKLKASSMLGALVKWFMILVFFTISLEMLNLYQVSEFMWGAVVPFMPKLAIAALVLMIAALVSEKLKDLVLASAKAAKIKGAPFIAGLVKWAVWLLAIPVALSQLNVSMAIINMLVGGLVFALSLALGLAFGLGGKEEAARYLAKLRKEYSDTDKD